MTDTTTQQKLEAMSRRHPELSWDSYEENAREMGLAIDSDEFFSEVLSEAAADLWG